MRGGSGTHCTSPLVLAGLAEAADLGEGRLPPPPVTQARSVAQRAQARQAQPQNCCGLPKTVQTW